MKDAFLDRRSFFRFTLAAGTLLPFINTYAAEPASGPFSLNPLPYATNALEPHIDAKTMEIHHGKHHATYVTKLNEALASQESLKGKALEDLVSDIPSISDKAAMNAVRNHGGGHWNHDFFWKTLAPAAESGAPDEKLTAAITAAFGSMDGLKEKFNAAAASRFGSGWAWLIVQDGKLAITSTPNQDNPLMKGIVTDAELGKPIMGIDVWEHAYYLNYQNKRADYITAFWNIINWKEVSARFSAAM